MSAELQVQYQSGKQCYFLVRNRNSLIWNTSSLAFEAYNSSNYTDYDISATEQGSSGFYVGSVPAAVIAGIYSVVSKQQLGGTVAESDPTIGCGDINWNGVNTLPLSDLSTSGQLAQVGPARVARGTAVFNFLFKMVSSADHVTNFTSGVISGQISKDGAAYGALQSGAFTEVGLGWYKTNLTSGDLLANVIGLVFTGTGISGGTADQRDIGMILQRTSGQAI